MIIIIFEELEIIYGYVQIDLLPLIPINIILLPQWILDVVVISSQRFISNIIIFNINYILLITGILIFYLLIMLMDKKYLKINGKYIESSLDTLLLIIIILELFLGILDQRSYLISSSIVSISLLAFMLLINKNKDTKFENYNKKIGMIIYWKVILFMNYISISGKVIDSIILYFDISMPYIENIFIIIVFTIFLIFHAKIIQELDFETQLQLNKFIILTIMTLFYFSEFLKDIFLHDWFIIWPTFIVAFFVFTTILYFKITEKTNITNHEVSMMIFLPFLLLIIGF